MILPRKKLETLIEDVSVTYIGLYQALGLFRT